MVGGQTLVLHGGNANSTKHLTVRVSASHLDGIRGFAENQVHIVFVVSVAVLQFVCQLTGSVFAGLFRKPNQSTHKRKKRRKTLPGVTGRMPPACTTEATQRICREFLHRVARVPVNCSTGQKDSRISYLHFPMDKELINITC